MSASKLSIKGLSLSAAAAVALVIGLTGCGQGSGNSNNNGTTAYTMGANGQCFNNQGQQVAQNMCTSSYGINGNHLINGQCYSASNQVLPVQSCQGSYGASSVPCYGPYTYPQNGTSGICNGANCSGYTLVSQTTGQTVVCQ